MLNVYTEGKTKLVNVQNLWKEYKKSRKSIGHANIGVDLGHNFTMHHLWQSLAGLLSRLFFNKNPAVDNNLYSILLKAKEIGPDAQMIYYASE